MAGNSEEYSRREVDLCVDSGSSCVTLQVDQRLTGGVDSVVWDASLVVCKYLQVACQRSNSLRGKSGLELGAGTAVCSLAMAALGAKVVATDLPESLPLMQRNIQLNQDIVTQNGGSISVGKLDWTKIEDRKRYSSHDLDLILIVDCIYYEASLVPLLDTLLSLTENKPETEILCAYEERDLGKPAIVQRQFLAESLKGFDISKIPLTDQHQEYRSEDIHLLKMIPKAHSALRQA